MDIRFAGPRQRASLGFAAMDHRSRPRLVDMGSVHHQHQTIPERLREREEYRSIIRPMKLHNRQRRSCRTARIVRILDNIRIKRSRAGRKGSKIIAVARGTGQRAHEAAAVGFSDGVDARRVDAELGAQVGEEVGGEDFVGNAGGGVRGAFPMGLFSCQFLFSCGKDGIAHVDAVRPHGDVVVVPGRVVQVVERAL